MTLPLIDSWAIVPVEGDRYPVNTVCANPRCQNPAEHGHHLVRRSKIIGDVWWIRLPDGMVIGNVIGLCAPCHAMVTGEGGGHKAAIRWMGMKLWWCDVRAAGLSGGITYHPVAPCSSQPSFGSDEEILGLTSKTTRCPTCGHSSHPKKRKQPARKRKTWTVQVPDDTEDGALVLDEIVDGVVAAFELEDTGGLTRFHALSRAGAFVLVNQSAIPEEAKG